MDASTTVHRREVLMVAAAGVAVAAPMVVPAPAVAGTRKVAKQIPLSYSYDPATGLTTVSKFRVKQVVARISGNQVLQKQGNRWLRIPYVWSKRRKSLVYSRQLHLQMIAASTGRVPAQRGAPSVESAPAQAPAAAAPTTSATETAPTPNPTTTTPTVTPVSVTPYANTDMARHVLRRVGYGVSTKGLSEVTAAGGALAWLEQQLEPDRISDTACDAILARLPAQSDEIWEVRDAINNGQREGWEQLMSVTMGHIVRAVWSRRQLLTTMEEFWANHFNVTVPADYTDDSRAHYQYTVRQHSLGRFEDLLMAATKHPAMLSYLNNRESDDSHPNENHGRELLELHTVGIEAGYGEQGVLNSARILTGLSVDNESGEFEYKPWRHWVGPVSVLGFSHANSTRKDGIAVADEYLRYLSHHPATARRIATKLARRFVSDDPPATLVNELTDIYLAQDTAIVPMLRHLFGSSAFWSSIGAKTRRPFESMMATLRILNVGIGADGIDHLRHLMWMADDMGQGPFGAAFPTGWPDVATAWSSTSVTLRRWNTNLALLWGWPNDLAWTPLRKRVLPTTLPATHGAGLDAIAKALFGMKLTAEHRTALLTFLGATAAAPLTSSSPLVTWRLVDVVALMLDSPYHHYR